MAKLRLVSRLISTTAAISIANMVFSGGCTSSGPTSQYGQDNFNAANRNMNQDYQGENAPGSYASSSYDDLKEWNFNSRMDRRSSANKNSMAQPNLRENSNLDNQALNQHDNSTVNNFHDVSAASSQGSNIANGTAPKTKKYKYLDPSNPNADQNGFVEISVPDYSDQEVANEQSQLQKQKSALSGSAPALPALSNNQPEQTAYNNQLQENNNWNQQSQYQNTNNQMAVNTNWNQATIASQQSPVQQRAMIQPGRITSIVIDNSNTDSYSPLVSEVPQISIPARDTQQHNQQKPVVYDSGYALPRINEQGTQRAGNIQNNVPIHYTNNNNRAQTAASRPAVPPINNRAQRNTISALAQYNMRSQINSVDELTGNLESLLSKDPENIDLQMALRYAYAAHGNYDKALQQLDVIPADSQRRSLALARATILSSQVESSNDPMVANSALSAIKILEDKVADKADLKISTFKICSKVDNFGQYEEIAEGSLSSGTACEVVIYCELENYQYQLNEDGKYFTSLHAEISLFDSSLNPLQQINEDVVDTPSFNKRKDFFLRGPFKLPQLSPGKYQIVISMEDKIAGKRALAARYPFEVKGPTALSGTLQAK